MPFRVLRLNRHITVVESESPRRVMRVKIAPSPLHGESEEVCRLRALREEGRRYRSVIAGSFFLFFWSYH
jgi:hypothetical protein